MNDVAIQVEGLSKRYRIGIYQQTHDRLTAQLTDFLTAPVRRAGKILRGEPTGASGLEGDIWALKDVSFQIKQGEVVGIIGRNGAGKSTVLKILSRITEPTKGFADIYGRVGSLLEVGTGFHPELTGRENIYLNGALLGMKRGEIERKFDEIVAFSEIERFLDTPVKHYSSGMYVRLAFSVAAHLEPEILLVDEVLAVGDIAFQKKCLGKMDDVAKRGRTVLFVSHNMGVVQSLCDRGILFDIGTVRSDGPISEVVDDYLQSLDQLNSEPLTKRDDRQGRGLVRLIGLEILNGAGEPTTTLVTGNPARFEFSVTNLIGGISCVFTVFNQYGQRIAAFKSDAPGPQDIYDSSIGLKFICEIDELMLLAGRYRINVLIRGGGEWQDYVESAASFDVQPGNLRGRFMKPFREISVAMPHRWSLPPGR
ncbi:MAG TPA: ABC transporter ATP-binding protein [Anaerolineales bacterium]|jgi:lipopolysaccharide transport system ATP-binding protein|nr:ABC transporter ATP-binding protein [Anaerolineales bacterium]